MSDRQLCTFVLDRLLFGVPVPDVQEVIRVHDLRPVPLAHPVIRGLINLRGQILTAFDLRRRLGLPEATGRDLPMTVVVRTRDGPASLLVDDVGDVLEAADESFEPPPETIPVSVRRLIRGVHKLRDRLLLVLDTDRAVDLEGI